MDAGSIKSQRFVAPKQMGQSSARPQNSLKTANIAKDALLAVQAELGTALRTAKILAQEDPPITEQEATETAERIADLLKASGDAFGADGVLFQDLSPDRARALLL